MKTESVNWKFTDSEASFGIVMGRLKSALELPTDAALCASLGISTSNFANRKKSGSIPMEQLVDLCLSRSLSLDWLFTGEGRVFANGPPPKVAAAPLDPSLHLSASIAVEDAMSSDSALMQGRPGAGRRARMVSAIYNDAVYVSEAERKATMRAQAEHYAEALRLANSSDAEIETTTYTVVRRKSPWGTPPDAQPEGSDPAD